MRLVVRDTSTRNSWTATPSFNNSKDLKVLLLCPSPGDVKFTNPWGPKRHPNFQNWNAVGNAHIIEGRHI